VLAAPEAYRAALHGPHRRVSYVTATDINGVVLAQDVPILGGTVRANLTNRVTRSADLEIPYSYFPDTETDPFSPYVGVVRIRSGIALGNGTEYTFPLFTGRVYNASLEEDGRAVLRADDLAADVVAARFEQPMASSRSLFATYVYEIQRLITDALPGAEFGTGELTDSVVPSLVWDEDRGQALDDLASAIGCRWYALGDGSFVIRRLDYSPAAPVQEFRDGPGGLMSRARISRTRDGAANSVVVVSERLDGSDPVRVVRRDNRPSSPTRWGGLFGRVVRIVKVQTPQTQNEAQLLAGAQLSASVALTEQWSCTVVPDQSIEPGDTARLRYRGRMADQVLDTVTYPLGPKSPMLLGSRGTVQIETVGA